jgi:hypothetical protein
MACSSISGGFISLLTYHLLYIKGARCVDVGYCSNTCVSLGAAVCAHIVCSLHRRERGTQHIYLKKAYKNERGKLVPLMSLLLC